MKKSLPGMRLVITLLLSFIICLSSWGQTGNFRSRTSGLWATPGTWDRDADSNGSFEEAPSSVAPTSASGTIAIQNTHVVTVGATLTTDQTTVQSGGTLTVNAGITVTLGTATGDDIKINAGGVLNVNGTIQLVAGIGGTNNRLRIDGTVNNRGAFLNSTSTKFIFQAGSNYFHLFDGTTTNAIPTAAWDLTSNLNITGFDVGGATAPTGLAQPFGNFIWNTPNMDQFIDLAGAPSLVNGNFQIEDTGGGGFYWNQGGGANSNLSVGGNFIVNGGTSAFIGQTGTNGVLTISGDLQVNGGYFQLTEDVDAIITVLGNLIVSGTSTFELSAVSAIADINLSGNYTFSGGDINVSSAPTGTGNLNFTGTAGPLAPQIFTSTLVPSGPVNYTISALSYLSVPSNNFIGGGGMLTVEGELQVGSTNSSGAMQAGTTAGNIRVSGSRIYDIGSTVTYNGTSGQFIGNGHPTSTGINTTINNSSGVSLIIGVPIIITTNLTLTLGNLNVGNGALTLSGNLAAGSNNITIGSGGSITISGTGTIGTFPFPSGSQIFTNFTLDNPNGVTFARNVTITGLTTLTDGTLSFGGNTLALNGTFAASGSGDLSPSSTSTLSIGGSGGAFGSPRINTTNNTVGTFTFARSGGGTASLSNTLIVSTTFNLTNGNFTNNSGLQMANGSTLIRNSNAQILGTSPTNLPSGQFYNVTYIGSTMSTGLELSTAANDNLGTLTINGGTVTLTQNIIINNDVNLLSSSLDANGFNITLSSASGTWNKTSGTFIGGSGTLLVDNSTHTSHYAVVASSAPNFTNLSIASGGSNSLTFPGSNVNVSGNIINNGTFSGGTGTVTFTGTTAITGSSTTSLNNVTISGSLTAPAATTLAISGNFINNGTFNHNNGSIGFNGSTTISGSSASNFFTVNLTGILNAPSGALGIAGNFSNSGTFNNNNGTVLLNGTVLPQIVSGSSLVFNNLTVSNPVSPGVSINNTVRLNGVLTLTLGAYFDADGSANNGIFILSSTSQIAGGRIAALSIPANFTGAVTVERYIQGQAGGDYRYLSMPITNGNVSLWKSSLFVTGNYSDRSTHADNTNITDSGNTNPSISTYNGTTSAYVPVNGSGGLTSATLLNSRVGYAAYDFNNGAVTASYRGPIEKGSIPITISSVNGSFNLIPNPYPSPIDWDNVTKTNVNNAMYLRVANNVFSSYVGGIATNPPFVGWTGEVATGQAFFTTANGGGTTLTLNESDKTNNSFYFLRTEPPDNYFRIQLISDKGQKDEMVIHFVDGATDNVDSEFDALKLKNSDPQLPLFAQKSYLNISSYLGSSPEAYSINSIAKLDGPKIVKLNISEVTPGDYTLNFSDFSTMSLGYKVILVDNYLNSETEIKDNATYTFKVDTKIESFGDSRFYLRINGEAIITSLLDVGENDMRVYPNPVSDKLQIKLSPDQEKNLKALGLYDILGSPMVSSKTNLQLLEPGVKTIDMSGYASGVYVLNIQYGDIVRSTRVVKK